MALADSDIAGVVHLAAQPGVRYRLENPFAYVTANVMGQTVMLELARALPNLKHFVYASTSSVYGANKKTPFAVGDAVEHPNSLYAATKRADELFGHTYAHLYGIPCTGLRFFTVYGPWGRPDMAPILFLSAILEGRPIDVYGQGKMQRDFTFVDDIVSGVVAALDPPAKVDPAWDETATDPATSGVAPWRIYNLGAGQPVDLMRYGRGGGGGRGGGAGRGGRPGQPGD